MFSINFDKCASFNDTLNQTFSNATFNSQSNFDVSNKFCDKHANFNDTLSHALSFNTYILKLFYLLIVLLVSQ
jgi:hypothetical protein